MRFLTPDGRVTLDMHPNLTEMYLDKGFKAISEDGEEAFVPDEEEEYAGPKCKATRTDGEPCQAKPTKDGLCMRHYAMEQERKTVYDLEKD